MKKNIRISTADANRSFLCAEQYVTAWKSHLSMEVVIVNMLVLSPSLKNSLTYPGLIPVMSHTAWKIEETSPSAGGTGFIFVEQVRLGRLSQMPLGGRRADEDEP